MATRTISDAGGNSFGHGVYAKGKAKFLLHKYEVK